jgi:hypothetical protein
VLSSSVVCLEIKHTCGKYYVLKVSGCLAYNKAEATNVEVPKLWGAVGPVGERQLTL